MNHSTPSHLFKFTIFSLVLLVFPAFVNAQSDVIDGLPDKVLVSFRKYNPTVDGVAWIIQQNKFVANYQFEDTDHQLWMSDLGKVLKHAFVTQEEQLPSVVKQALYKAFPSCKILVIYQIDIQTKKFYQLKIKIDRERRELIMDSRGHQVKDQNLFASIKVSFDE